MIKIAAKISALLIILGTIIVATALIVTLIIPNPNPSEPTKTPAAARVEEIFQAVSASNYDKLIYLTSPQASDIYRDRSAVAMSMAAMKEMGVEIIGSKVVAEYTTATRLVAVLAVLIMKDDRGQVVENPTLVLLDEELLLIEVR